MCRCMARRTASDHYYCPKEVLLGIVHNVILRSLVSLTAAVQALWNGVWMLDAAPCEDFTHVWMWIRFILRSGRHRPLSQTCLREDCNSMSGSENQKAPHLATAVGDRQICLRILGEKRGEVSISNALVSAIGKASKWLRALCAFSAMRRQKPLLQS